MAETVNFDQILQHTLNGIEQAKANGPDFLALDAANRLLAIDESIVSSYNAGQPENIARFGTSPGGQPLVPAEVMRQALQGSVSNPDVFLQSYSQAGGLFKRADGSLFIEVWSNVTDKVERAKARFYEILKVVAQNLCGPKNAEARRKALASVAGLLALIMDAYLITSTGVLSQAIGFVAGDVCAYIVTVGVDEFCEWQGIPN